MDLYTRFTMLELKEFIQKPITAGTFDEYSDEDIANTGIMKLSKR